MRDLALRASVSGSALGDQRTEAPAGRDLQQGSFSPLQPSRPPAATQRLQGQSLQHALSALVALVPKQCSTFAVRDRTADVKSIGLFGIALRLLTGAIALLVEVVLDRRFEPAIGR